MPGPGPVAGSRAIGAGLLTASVGAGCLDVLSYNALGEVFPSAMTGNLALLGRGLGGGDLHAIERNLCAFAAFFAGTIATASVLRGTPGKVRFLLALAAQAIVLATMAWFWPERDAADRRLVLIAAASAGMGMQSAVATRIGLDAVSTTYFTGLTVKIATGLVARHGLRRVGWPVLALAAYVAGAALAGASILARPLPMLAATLPLLPLLATLLLALIVAGSRSEPA